MSPLVSLHRYVLTRLVVLALAGSARKEDWYSN